MGRVKSTAIKKTARKLFDEHEDSFGRDFDKNKKLVTELIECEKKTRNKVTGYITRLKRK